MKRYSVLMSAAAPSFESTKSAGAEAAVEDQQEGDRGDRVTRVADDPGAQGGARDTSDHAPAPRLPHEHDQSHDQHADAPRAPIKQAHDDLENGLEDTEGYSAASKELMPRLRERSPSASPTEGVERPAQTTQSQLPIDTKRSRQQ